MQAFSAMSSSLIHEHLVFVYYDFNQFGNDILDSFDDIQTMQGLYIFLIIFYTSFCPLSQPIRSLSQSATLELEGGSRTLLCYPEFSLEFWNKN